LYNFGFGFLLTTPINIFPCFWPTPIFGTIGQRKLEKSWLKWIVMYWMNESMNEWFWGHGLCPHKWIMMRLCIGSAFIRQKTPAPVRMGMPRIFQVEMEHLHSQACSISSWAKVFFLFIKKLYKRVFLGEIQLQTLAMFLKLSVLARPLCSFKNF